MAIAQVLELLLFHEALNEIHKSTTEILDCVKKRVIHLSEKEEDKDGNQGSAKQKSNDDPLEIHPFVFATHTLNTLAEAILGGNKLPEQRTSEKISI